MRLTIKASEVRPGDVLIVPGTEGEWVVPEGYPRRVDDSTLLYWLTTRIARYVTELVVVERPDPPVTITIELTQAARAVAWHEARFPDAQPALVALKVCEEAGEVASAVLGDIGTTSATGKGDVLGECADVLIAMMVLLGRWYPFTADLGAAVDAKLAMLADPQSKHPASLAAAPDGQDRP